MARIRTIKPEFFTSLTIAALPLTARMTFIGLWTHADDHGKCVDDSRLIRAAIWPLDDRTIGDLDDDLKALAEAGLIRRFWVDERRYIRVTGWAEHQKISHPTSSKLPDPPDDDEDPPTRGNADLRKSSGEPPEDSGSAPEKFGSERKGTGNREQGTGKGSNPSGYGADKSSRTTRGTRIPTDFVVTGDMVAWAQTSCPDVDGRYETAQFVDFWMAKSGKDATKVDWVRCWQTWMRKAQKDASGKRGATPIRGRGFQTYRNPTAPDAYDDYHNVKDDPDAA